MSDFIVWSGWGCTVITTIIAIIQFRKNSENKARVKNLEVKMGKVVQNAKEKGVAINVNNGDINIS
jgi:hypothetical protein